MIYCEECREMLNLPVCLDLENEFCDVCSSRENCYNNPKINNVDDYVQPRQEEKEE